MYALYNPINKKYLRCRNKNFFYDSDITADLDNPYTITILTTLHIWAVYNIQEGNAEFEIHRVISKENTVKYEKNKREIELLKIFTSLGDHMSYFACLKIYDHFIKLDSYSNYVIMYSKADYNEDGTSDFGSMIKTILYNGHACTRLDKFEFIGFDGNQYISLIKLLMPENTQYICGGEI